MTALGLLSLNLLMLLVTSAFAVYVLLIVVECCRRMERRSIWVKQHAGGVLIVSGMFVIFVQSTIARFLVTAVHNLVRGG